jgi:hypothetical protein
MRLAKETVNQEDALNAADNIDIEDSLTDMEDDKTFAAMGIAKTISTVGFVHLLSLSGYSLLLLRSLRQSNHRQKFCLKSRKLSFRLLDLL